MTLHRTLFSKVHPVEAAILTLLTIALAGACGKANERPAEADSDAAGVRSGARTAPQPVESVASEPVFVPVELPAAFPPDFPIAPESTVIEAASRTDSGGVLSRITILADGEARGIFDWYAEALAAAGWMMASEVPTGSGLTLRATQGESYVDLTVEPYAEHSTGGWVRTRAVIWKAER